MYLGSEIVGIVIRYCSVGSSWWPISVGRGDPVNGCIGGRYGITVYGLEERSVGG